MAMSKRKRAHNHYGKDGKKLSAAELAARLAPVEELRTKNGRPAREDSGNGDNAAPTRGAIIVGSSNIKVAQDFSGEDDNKSVFLSIDPVVLAIVILSLFFIAFIAYLISGMPPPAR